MENRPEPANEKERLLKPVKAVERRELLQLHYPKLVKISDAIAHLKLTAAGRESQRGCVIF